jgi:hypothetical protein
MEQEQWKQIEDFPVYEISNLGNVRKSLKGGSYKPIVSNPAPYYLMFSTWINGILQRRYVHREVLKAFSPSEDPTLTHVCFKNGDHTDTRLENLYWSSQARRMVRRFHENGYERGEDHFAAKLTEQDVRDIRQAWQEGTSSQSAMARKYGMHPSTINNIIAGRYWSHLEH